MRDEDNDKFNTCPSSNSGVTWLMVDLFVKELAVIESENVMLEESEYLQKLTDEVPPSLLTVIFDENNASQ